MLMERPGPVSRFLFGLGAAMRGAGMLSARPSLWIWLIVPVLVNLLVAILLGGAIVAATVWISQSLHPHFAGTNGEQSWWSWSLEWLLFIILTGVAILPLLLVWKILEMILFGVAYARITEAVERERLRPGITLRPLSILQDLGDAILNAAILICGFLVIFLLNFIPLVGSVLSLVLGILWGGFVQGLDLVGVCRSLRGERRLRQIEFCRRNSCETLGLGMVGFTCSLLPVLGPILVASCAVGAVLVHEEIERRVSLK
jgi:CysZ protein